MTTDDKTITVIGAGMVGTCCALALQDAGFDVTLIDRKAPGEEASFGNLACFGIASCVPPGAPGLWKKLPRLLRDPESPLRIRRDHALAMAPWLWSYLRNSSIARYEANAAARQSLLEKVHDALDPWVREAGASDLLHHGGLLFTFESEAAFKNAAYAFDVRCRNRVEMDLLDGNEARQCEPALAKSVIKAYRVPKLVHTVNPGALVKALARLFAERGGRIVQDEVRGFDIGPDGVRAMVTSTGQRSVERVVIAAGVWSRALAKMLGTSVPLEAERGYHAMYEGAEVRMNSAVLSVDRSIAITPMNYGIRAGGAAEFARPDAPADWTVAQMVQRHAEALVPGLGTTQHDRVSTWVGPRPSHPDSKPAIGRAPHQPNAWFAFGHDHLGLTMGSITGKLIAELVTGAPTSVDVTPFRPDRFGRRRSGTAF